MIPGKVMLIAGEASGDTLGAELVNALKRTPEVLALAFPPRFFGTGGPRMAQAGVELAFDMTTHAVVGLWEVLKNYGKFKALFDQLLDLACQELPDVIVLIDYPGFNLRFAHALRKRARANRGAFKNWRPRIVFYVSPQIWAWHESRIHQIAEDIDLLLTIFPFEKAWYAERKPNFKVEFVGHPLIDRYAEMPLIRPRRDSPLVLLLPGSRVRELRKHLPPMLEAVKIISKSVSAEFRMVLPNAALAAQAREQGLPAQVTVVIGQLASSLGEATIAMASSGTVTMECAFFGVPTVVLYITSWSTHFLGRRLIRVKYIAMPNLLADEMIFPEFIQEAATPENMAAEALKLLNTPALSSVVKTKLVAVVASLGNRGASDRAARAILNL
jgi:lipid-A-disaccharide synthase